MYGILNLHRSFNPGSLSTAVSFELMKLAPFDCFLPLIAYAQVRSVIIFPSGCADNYSRFRH